MYESSVSPFPAEFGSSTDLSPDNFASKDLRHLLHTAGGNSLIATPLPVSAALRPTAMMFKFQIPRNSAFEERIGDGYIQRSAELEELRTWSGSVTTMFPLPEDRVGDGSLPEWVRRNLEDLAPTQVGYLQELGINCVTSCRF